MAGPFAVTLELDRSWEMPLLEALLEVLQDHDPAASVSPFGTVKVTITLPADSLAQAVSAALLMVGRIAPVITVTAMPSSVRDDRE